MSRTVITPTPIAVYEAAATYFLLSVPSYEYLLGESGPNLTTSILGDFNYP